MARCRPAPDVDLVTGLVDSVSYLTFGHVFVANMTGNVVLLGFALAGAHGLSVPASLAALAAFLLGALAGGRIATLGEHSRPAPAHGVGRPAAIGRDRGALRSPGSPWPKPRATR